MKVAVRNISWSEEKFEIGKELVQEGEFERAELMLKKAIRLNPKNAEAYFWLGVTLYNKEDYERAILVLTKCIELAPDDYKAYGLRGYNHYELFELEKAIADYTKAIEIEPDDVISYNNRGLAHEKNGEYELSLEDYTKAVELEPNEVSGYYNRGNIYLKLAEYEKAIAEYNKALEMSDDEWLTSCIKMNQETAEKLLLKGERKVWGRTPVNIRIYFDKVIAMDSNYVEAYLNRGLAIVKWGNSGIYVANYKKAIADFDKVLELEPDNEQARKYREFCCEQLSKKEEDEIDD